MMLAAGILAKGHPTPPFVALTRTSWGIHTCGLVFWNSLVAPMEDPMGHCEDCHTSLHEATTYFSLIRGYHDGPPYLVCTDCGWRLIAFATEPVPAPYADIPLGTVYAQRGASHPADCACACHLPAGRTADPAQAVTV